MVATVSAVSSASGATRYYERDDYYAKHNPEYQRGVSGMTRLPISNELVETAAEKVGSILAEYLDAR